MHSAALHLTPLLAAEKNKAPFYVVGGLLVAWALIVSLALGLNRPGFPGGLRGQRAVIAISAILVLATVSTAVITSGGATTSQAQGASGGAQGPAASPPATTAPSPAGGAAPAPAGALKVAASATTLAYDTKLLRAKAGTVTISFSNHAPLEHNLTVAQGSTVLGATPTFTGGTRTLTVTLKPGSYVFYCTVPGHRQAGMEGTLKVS